jgi:hypothetical protein
MLGMIDVRDVRENSEDLAALRAFLQQLVGEPFLHARFSYGDELMLHFGSPCKLRTTKLAHLSEGSYIVATRASSWYLKTTRGSAVTVTSSGLAASNQDGAKRLTTEQIEGHQLIEPGSRIVAATATAAESGSISTAFNCSLLLSDGSSLLIVPEKDSDNDFDDVTDDVADWEVFTPHERYLRVGPGRNWSYLPSRSNPSSEPAMHSPD